MTLAARKATLAPSNSVVDHLPLYRLSVEQYQRMEEMGVFGGDRVELLEGFLVRKGPMNPPHAVSTRRVTRLLESRLPPGWCLRPQMDVALPDSRPQPEVAIAIGTDDDYADHHPGPGDIALVVEVSDSTLDRDRGEMQRIYARARLPVYWIVNIPERQLEVYTQPRAGKNPAYRQCQVIAPPGSVSVTIGATVVGPIPVADLLPPS
jgi:Uma2 family endonuclease